MSKLRHTWVVEENLKTGVRRAEAALKTLEEGGAYHQEQALAATRQAVLELQRVERKLEAMIRARHERLRGG